MGSPRCNHHGWWANWLKFLCMSIPATAALATMQVSHRDLGNDDMLVV